MQFVSFKLRFKEPENLAFLIFPYWGFCLFSSCTIKRLCCDFHFPSQVAKPMLPSSVKNEKIDHQVKNFLKILKIKLK